jgi:Domain of unknown function (DUF4365)
VTRGAPKSLPSRIRRGQQGINLIERIVLEMGSSWSPTGALDVGIDGTIELFDLVSQAALGKILGVQSKVVANPKNETDEGFDYYCEERDPKLLAAGKHARSTHRLSTGARRGVLVVDQGLFQFP